MREIVDGDEHLPFIVNEFINSFGEIPLHIYRLPKDQIKRKKIRKVDPLHLALNVLGMCIFTFISRPILEMINKQADLGVVFDDAFFEKRIEAILDMVFNGIVKEHES